VGYCGAIIIYKYNIFAQKDQVYYYPDLLCANLRAGLTVTVFVMAEVEVDGTRARSWVFTENNPGAVPFEFSPETMVYLIYQLETAPTTGTPHFQGYLVWKNPQTRKKCRSLNERIRWAVAKGNAQQNTTYCSKEPRSAPFVVHGVEPAQGKA